MSVNLKISLLHLVIIIKIPGETETVKTTSKIEVKLQPCLNHGSGCQFKIGEGKGPKTVNCVKASDDVCFEILCTGGFMRFGSHLPILQRI